MGSNFNSVSEDEKANIIKNLKEETLKSLIQYSNNLDDNLINNVSKSLIQLRNICANLDARDKYRFVFEAQSILIFNKILFRDDLKDHIFKLENIFKSMPLNNSNIKRIYIVFV